jgi:hypothetical protein
MVTGSAACVELAGGDVGDAEGFSAGPFPLEQPARANNSIADAARDARARFMCDSPFKNFWLAVTNLLQRYDSTRKKACPLPWQRAGKIYTLRKL